MMDNVTALQQNSQNFTSFTCRYGLISFYCIVAGKDNIIHLTFAQEKHKRAIKLLTDNKQTVTKGKHEEFSFSPVFQDYFTGHLTRFPMKIFSPFISFGTDFQKQVWAGIAEIPYGQTRTYGDLARGIGRPGSARAVGSACGANPLALIIPCHRVVGTQGLGGFAGGIAVKKKLLGLEMKPEKLHAKS
jgi:methylated-DNA-[protein]-cysteine S-methyltransferase